jgi:hypothetical protein
MLSPPEAKKSFLVVAVLAMVVGGLVGYQAVSNEISGTATYHKYISWNRTVPVLVTRRDSPSEFHQATNYLWMVSVLCLVVAGGGVALYRKLSDCV